MKYVIMLFVLCAAVYAQTVSPERQVYLNALNEYNAYASHRVTTKQMKDKYWLDLSAGNPRKTVACYLSAQIVVAAMKDPVLWADKNANLEGKEWRRWIDIRQYELKCQDIK